MSVRLERLIRMYNRLRRGPVTIEIISKWAKSAGISVSDRQLYRDLNELQHLQIAKGENVVEYIDEKNRKTWKLEYDDSAEKITQFDLNSFFLFKNFIPYTIYEQRKPAIEKFEKILYKNYSKNKYQQLVQANELYMRRTNYFNNLYGETEHQQIEDLIWALNNKRVIVIESSVINPANIHLATHPFPLQMIPLELVFHAGRVHIAGTDTGSKKLLIFTLDKGLQFTLTNTAYNRKNYFDWYDGQFKKLFGFSDPAHHNVYHIKIELTKGFGQSWMNFFWHHTQRWELLPNGNYMLHLHCSIGRELIGFLAHGLDKMKIHGPKILKELYIKKLQQTLEIYKKDRPINEEEANKDY